MHPHLFTLPWGTQVNAYGTLIMLGGLACLPMTAWDARDRGIAPGRRLSFIVDLWLVIVVGAFVGGRVLHVLTVPGVYAEDPSKLVTLDDTGFVFFGSLLAIATGWVWLARRYDTQISTLWDMGLTWVPLGHAAGRFGCLLAGCCWGGVHTGGGGIRFGPESVVVLTGGAPVVGRGDMLTTLPLHPTQLYEALGLLLLLAIAVVIRVRVGSNGRGAWPAATPWATACFARASKCFEETSPAASCSSCATPRSPVPCRCPPSTRCCFRSPKSPHSA